MKMKDIRKQIKQELAPFMKERGFYSDKEGTGYIREFEGGFHKFIVAIFNYAPLYKLGCAGGIRLDAVEELVNQVIGVVEPDMGKQTATIMLNRRIVDGPTEMLIEFMEPDDLSLGLEHIKKVFDAKYAPVLNQCVDVKSVFEKLCSVPDFDGAVPPHSWFTAVALAALNQSPLFEQWSKEYAAAIVNPKRQQQFAQLVEMLRPIATGEKAN